MKARELIEKVKECERAAGCSFCSTRAKTLARMLEKAIEQRDFAVIESGAKWALRSMDSELDAIAAGKEEG